jgi:hypothetical protein
MFWTRPVSIIRSSVNCNHNIWCRHISNKILIYDAQNNEYKIYTNELREIHKEVS